ncbi:hypothetical protein BLA6993_05345 [Burkholderia lata]|uniref:hypothetical protein n=1 Tax=Burkholderia lata (strain ATCC 17760 / DSM 23089 / LMG 22485 / NCIMB 9086 / R18194 / 383) TaxID=482957 RepID=UPI001453AF5D|nr:hypothetical protein [Burkholderia lata]VWC11092.1 hypothetical protein BLA6993_05345 [Burkholderia lata]
MDIPVLCYERGLDSTLVDIPLIVIEALCPEFAAAFGIEKLPAARFWDIVSDKPVDGQAFTGLPCVVELHNALHRYAFGPFQIRQTYIHELAHHVDFSVRGYTAHDEYFGATATLLALRAGLERVGIGIRNGRPDSRFAEFLSACTYGGGSVQLLRDAGFDAVWHTANRHRYSDSVTDAVSSMYRTMWLEISTAIQANKRYYGDKHES